MVDQTSVENRFEPEILELIPHRPPMLLINSIFELSQTSSRAITYIDAHTPFFEENLGVPSWIGLEYMGQTAALIAGFQLRAGLVKPHLGLLLGTRTYQAKEAYFPIDRNLLIQCKQLAIVGESLITFDCQIRDELSDRLLAQASLSVFRKAH